MEWIKYSLVYTADSIRDSIRTQKTIRRFLARAPSKSTQSPSFHILLLHAGILHQNAPEYYNHFQTSELSQASK